jgi:hypothetical protein
VFQSVVKIGSLFVVLFREPTLLFGFHNGQIVSELVLDILCCRCYCHVAILVYV